MKCSRKYLIVIITSLSVITSCSKGDLYNFILGPQPNFIDDNKFVPGFNILGVLRPDSLGNLPMSMVHVERVLPAIGNENDSLEVTDARIMVYRILNDQAVDSTQFNYTKNDTLYAIYKPMVFRPKAGERYCIKCSNSYLPILTSETVIPDIPVIVDDDVNVSQGSITFSIQNNSSASMYDAYLYIGDRQFTYRVMQPENENTQVVIYYSGIISSDAKLVIYAYDKNLTKYFTAPNVFIKPNTYRPPFNNVENGYGCFGSMNLLVKRF